MPPKLNKEGRYEIQFTQGGRRVHRVLPEGTTRKQANEKEIQLKRAVFDAEELGHEQKWTIGEGITRYLKEFSGKSRRATENHARALEAYVRGRTIPEIAQCAERIRSVRWISASTRNRRLAILRRVANLAYGRWGWIKAPIKVELLPENKPRDAYLTRTELATLIRRVKNREARRVILALAFTGMRCGELFGLEPHDIRGNAICLTDSKSGSPRNIPIVPQVAFIFRRLPFEISYDHTAHLIETANFVDARTGLRIRAHDLRHTTASLLVNEGVDLYVVGKILGHKSPATTKRYAHLQMSTVTAAMHKLEPKRTEKDDPEGKSKRAVSNG